MVGETQDARRKTQDFKTQDARLQDTREEEEVKIRKLMALGWLFILRLVS
jgi:hypothetical protein